MSLANPLWEHRESHGELLKLGSVCPRRPSPSTWWTHPSCRLRVGGLFSTTMPHNWHPRISSCTDGDLRLLFVFVVLAHHRRRVIHFNVTAHPTSEWTARQIAQGFLWDSAPAYLLHDRDSTYGGTFRQRVKEMGIREVLSAPSSPWPSPYVERLIGSIRRECLDHIMVLMKPRCGGS